MRPRRVVGSLMVVAALVFLVWALTGLGRWTGENPVAAGMGLFGMLGASVLAAIVAGIGLLVAWDPSDPARLAGDHAFRQRR